MKRLIISCFFVVFIFTSAQSSEFQVNTRTSSDQADPDIAICEDGSFVVVWRSYNQDGNSNGIFAQLFDPNCLSIGDEFQVNTTITGNQTAPAVAMDAAGNFIVTWHGPGIIDPNQEDIFAQWFDPNALAISDEIQVNSDTSDRQRYSCAALNQNGNFIVVWESMNFPF